MEIILGSYRLDVDVAATRAYYEAHPLPWITCTCKGCENFEKAIRQIPQEVKVFFDQLGLDPEKPAETCYYQGTETTLSGGGWYHICGTILESAMPESPSESGLIRLKDSARRSNQTVTCCRRISRTPVFRWNSIICCHGCWKRRILIFEIKSNESLIREKPS